MGGPLPTELGRATNEAQELRVEGDYGAGTPDATEVAAMLQRPNNSLRRLRASFQVPRAEASPKVRAGGRTRSVVIDGKT
jgi:hypothetical protein